MGSTATLDSSAEEIISYPHQDLNPRSPSLMTVAIPITLMQPPQSDTVLVETEIFQRIWENSYSPILVKYTVSQSHQHLT